MDQAKKLQNYVKKKDISGINKLLSHMHSADIAEMYEKLPIYDVIFSLRVLETKHAASVFSLLDSDIQEDIINAFTNQETDELVNSLFTDDIVDLIDEMPVNIQKKIFRSVSGERRSTINTLLRYSDDTAGSITNTAYIELNLNDTCQSALDKIKEQAQDVYTVDYCYIIDNFLTFVGGIALKEIVIHDKKTPIRKIMDGNHRYIKASASQEEAIDIIRKYDYTTLPVVNHEKKLIGIITVDDIIDALDEENTEDIHLMNAVTPFNESYKKVSIFKMYRKRIPWLLVLMLAATLSQTIMNNNQKILQIAGLSIFIPMLLGTGGNAGGQASSIIIRAMVLNEVTPRDIFYVIRKEIGVALLIGITLAIVNYIKMLFVPALNVNILTLLVVSLTIIIAVVIANCIGGILPILAKVLNLDPAVLSGPFISTVLDSITLLIYFALASFILL
jgi:magnesium transporter